MSRIGDILFAICATAATAIVGVMVYQKLTQKPPTPTEKRIVSISVEPKDLSLPAGQAHQYSAKGTLSDGSTSDVTGQVGWATTDPTIATVSSAGLVTALGAGACQVVAAVSQELYGSTTLTVTEVPGLVSISVAPKDISLQAGSTRQYMAVRTLSDSSTLDITGQVVWTTTDPAIATVSSTGLVTAVGAGTCHVVATVSDELFGSTTLAVTSAPQAPVIEKFESYPQSMGDVPEDYSCHFNHPYCAMKPGWLVAETFTPKESHWCTHLWLYVGGPQDFADLFRFYLYRAEDVKIAKYLVMKTVTTYSLPSSSWQKITLDTPILLEAGQEYAIGVEYEQTTFGLTRGAVAGCREIAPGEYDGRMMVRRGSGEGWEVTSEWAYFFQEWGYRA